MDAPAVGIAAANSAPIFTPTSAIFWGTGPALREFTIPLLRSLALTSPMISGECMTFFLRHTSLNRPVLFAIGLPFSSSSGP